MTNESSQKNKFLNASFKHIVVVRLCRQVFHFSVDDKTALPAQQKVAVWLRSVTRFRDQHVRGVSR